MVFTLDSKTWAGEQFGACDLGDKRRTKRLIKMAEQVSDNPSAGFCAQMETWGDLKAAYRLFAEDDVTFEAIARPHWEQTKRMASGRCLVINDTTELDFGKRHDIQGLAAIGNGSGRGFLLHNAILIDANSQEMLGVAGQKIHYRKARPKKETAAQRLKRDRESKVWGEVVDDVGRPPKGVQWVHVCDRGADSFEVYCHFVAQQADWVVRASSLHRVILTPDAEEMPLSAYLLTLPLAGTYELKLRARPEQPARTAKLEVRFGKLQMPAPAQQSPYVKARNLSSIEMWVVEVREVDVPQGVKPITWVLYTSLPVATFAEAQMIIEYYEARWLVEEYHKALKTGCSVKKHLLRRASRLEPMVGLMSVVAMRLLQLKSVARTEPDRPARTIVPRLWLIMLKAARKNLRRVHDLTIREFYRELAKLGGFLGRKSDGEPGWITIWRGWEKLNTLVRGAELALRFKSKLEKCG
jgi:Transposase DNA-binding/Transposase Tn5 dimerisation domain